MYVCMYVWSCSQSWTQVAAAGHRTVMSNEGVFYLDYYEHSAQRMWLNISALGNATEEQVCGWGNARVRALVL